MFFLRTLLLAALFLTTSFLRADVPSPKEPPMQQELPSPTPLPEPLPSSEVVTGSYENAFFKMILTLAALIVLIIFTIWMLKKLSSGRLNQMNQSRRIKILERRPLSAKSVLYLIEFGGKKVVISESQLEVRSIATMESIPPPEEA